MFKIKSNSKHFKFSRMAKACRNANLSKLYSLQDIHSWWGGGGGGGVGQGLPKTLSEQPHLASGCFMKLFYKTTTCPKIKCLFVIFSLVYDIFDSIWLTQKIFLADWRF